jgi:adenylate cyclase
MSRRSWCTSQQTFRATAAQDGTRNGRPQMIFPCYDGFATLNSTSVMAEAESYFALAQEVLRPKHGLNSEALGVLPFSD